MSILRHSMDILRGSARPGQRKRMTASARQVTRQVDLAPPTHVALLGYNQRAFVRCAPKPLGLPMVRERVRALPDHVCGDYSQHTDGLSKALEMAKRRPKGWEGRIVWFTDGQPNPPNQHPLLIALAQEARRCHVKITCVAVTDHQYQPVLAEVARTTGGHCVTGSTPSQIASRLQLLHPGRSQLVVLLVDCSGSMILGYMAHRRRIDVVVDLLLKALP